MFGINLKHSLATLAVAAGLLAAAGSASAGTHDSAVIAYSGHAGLGASVYQHNQSDLEFLTFSPQGPGSEGFRLGSNDALAAGVADGTSNTVAFGDRAAAQRGFSVDIGTSENVAADAARDAMSRSVSSYPAGPAHTITMLDYQGSPLKAESNEVGARGVTAETPSLVAEGNLYAGVARTSAGFKSLSGMDSETEFMDYTDDSLLD
jgi:hypothetical protein